MHVPRSVLARFIIQSPTQPGPLAVPLNVLPLRTFWTQVVSFWQSVAFGRKRDERILVRVASVAVAVGVVRRIR
jgi:hypothetical protein